MADGEHDQIVELNGFSAVVVSCGIVETKPWTRPPVSQTLSVLWKRLTAGRKPSERYLVRATLLMLVFMGATLGYTWWVMSIVSFQWAMVIAVGGLCLSYIAGWIGLVRISRRTVSRS
ncbi:MAG: hypothetical protein JRN62_02630 [Nitrososphaerota archaeon]|jgi:hypothetical protein|nr:hypothetical protein [Nitrososphaerota archaeon]MDG6948895.1 hypothetical protein [Nitrososphaerota archaeon]